MRIDNINIRRRYQGGYDCDVTVDGEFQSIKLKLDDEHTQRVIETIADLIVAGSKQVAENLTKQALDHSALEHKTGDATA